MDFNKKEQCLLALLFPNSDIEWIPY